MSGPVGIGRQFVAARFETACRSPICRKKKREALELSNKAVVEALDGLPAHKLHCSVLAEEAVRAAVKDYYDRNGIPYDQEKFAEHCSACHEGQCHCG